MLDLKLCSVNYNSNEYLKINKSIILPNNIDWLIVQNNEKDERLGGFEYINGIYDFKEPPNSKTIGRASYHHAAALNKACRSKLLNNRFILLLDPDFFIVPSLQVCIQYMLDNNLAFFGSPYAIEPDKKRVQDFPVAFCMFIDTHQVPLSELDFTPAESHDFATDTGYDIYRRFVNSGLKHEATLPVFNYKGKSPNKSSKFSLKNKYGIATEAKIDEYFWQDKLFGLHCHMKLHLRHGEDVYRRSVIQCLHATRIIEIVREYDTSI